jgi:lipopolysaccharide/colanic/teichoic acid biosynthesis glycosyltransferase
LIDLGFLQLWADSLPLKWCIPHPRVCHCNDITEWTYNMTKAARTSITLHSGLNAGALVGRYEFIKPMLDSVAATTMLVISAPIVLLALLVVRLTSNGPAIYTQKRMGLKGHIFTIYKIRTMYHDSERATGAVWSLPGDPRVTPVGRFLRWSHIDELPQLVNILRGEMSLIGPRPERPELISQIEKVLPDYRLRLTVLPGLTGLAQVQQPPDTDLASVDRKLTFDLCYVERTSFGLDLRILLGTVLKCLGVPFGTIGRICGFSSESLWFDEQSLGTGLETATAPAVAPSCVN